MYLRSDWFIQELRYLKFQVHIKMVKYTFKWGGVNEKFDADHEKKFLVLFNRRLASNTTQMK